MPADLRRHPSSGDEAADDVTQSPDPPTDQPGDRRPKDDRTSSVTDVAIGDDATGDDTTKDDAIGDGTTKDDAIGDGTTKDDADDPHVTLDRADTAAGGKQVVGDGPKVAAEAPDVRAGTTDPARDTSGVNQRSGDESTLDAEAAGILGDSLRDPSKRDSDAAQAAAQAVGDRILHGMQGAPDSVQAGQEVSAPADGAEISKLVDQLADRVLVSQPSLSAGAEVRIKLQQNVLQGTEISIRRDQGELVVSLQVGSRAFGEQLSTTAASLQSGLTNRLNEPVRVEVNVHADSGGRDARDQSDGRSRNRRDPNEMLDESDDDAPKR